MFANPIEEMKRQGEILNSQLAALIELQREAVELLRILVEKKG